MIYTYAFIATFMFGIYIGATAERGEKIDFPDLILMALLAAIRPIVMTACGYVYLSEHSK